MSESEVVQSGLPCESCGSSDALALYDDGHQWCFSCETHTPGDGSEQKTPKTSSASGLLPVGEYQALGKRKLKLETCKKYRYSVGSFKGKTVHIATFCDDAGKPVMQKVRTPGKDFIQLGDKKSPPLFGQHLCRDSGKMIVVTEGELDAMAAAQALSPKLTWPAVSVPNGAQSAKKHLANHIEWLSKYEKVVLAFDMDEPGRKAAEECAALFPPGKAHIAHLPAKDACEALQKGQYKELVNSFWGAKEWRPDGIVTVDEILDDVLTDPQHGAPYPWASLTEATYGRQSGEVITIGAGTGVGKTDVLTQMVAYDINELKVKCGVIFLEQSPRQTVRRLAGKIDAKRYHLPQDEEGWDPEQLEKTVRSIGDGGMVYLYDNWGAMEWEVIRAKVRYMVASLGVKHVYLDHLTALAAASDNEREALEKIMAEIAGLAQELQIVFHVVSHLATPEGTPHEEGARVKMRHFKGSRAIGFWTHSAIGLERNQQAEDEDERFTTTFRLLKHRLNGEAVGRTFQVKYQPTTGLLNEIGDGDMFDEEAGF